MPNLLIAWIFVMNKCWNLVKWFFSIYWANHNFLLDSDNVLTNFYWFPNFKPTLPSWKNLPLGLDISIFFISCLIQFVNIVKDFCVQLELTHWKRLWCWEGLGAGGKGDDRGWDGWMASPTRWTWVWVNSRSWWWTGRPGVLRFMGSQRVGHNWVTELNWIDRRNGGLLFCLFVLVSCQLLISGLCWPHKISCKVSPFSSVLKNCVGLILFPM